MKDKATRNKSIRLLMSISLVAAASIAYTIDRQKSVLDENVKGVGDVTISAQVPYYTEVILDPEKRIPPSGNDSVEIELQFRSPGSTSPLYSTNLITDFNGIGQLPPLDPDVLPPGQYDIAVKGISHLKTIFSNVTLSPIIDLTYQVLPAGDTHPSSDNLVNSLDVAYSISQLYGGETRSDLNRDGRVNSLDFATQISHFNQQGDE